MLDKFGIDFDWDVNNDCWCRLIL